MPLVLVVLGHRRLGRRLLGGFLRGDLLLRFLLLLLGGLVLFVAGPRGACPEQPCHRRADPDELLHGGPRPARTAGSLEPSAAALALPPVAGLPVRRTAWHRPRQLTLPDG